MKFFYLKNSEEITVDMLSCYNTRNWLSKLFHVEIKPEFGPQ